MHSALSSFLSVLAQESILFFVKTPLSAFIIFMGKKTNRIGKIPAFIKKLKEILEDKGLSDIIQWLPEGNGFQILNTSSFTERVLPQFFKHRNIASFVRQLNMYGFNRPKDSEQNVYIHPRFLKGNLNSMKLIKRKVGQQKESSEDDSIESESPMEKVDLQKKEIEMLNEHQKLLAQNQRLRTQNAELNSKLSIFEDMIGKIKLYTQEMEKFINLTSEETENEKTEKQATASNSSNDSNSFSNSSSNRKGFSLCSSNSCPPHYESSYQILLQGVRPEKGGNF